MRTKWKGAPAAMRRVAALTLVLAFGGACMLSACTSSGLSTAAAATLVPGSVQKGVSSDDLTGDSPVVGEMGERGLAESAEGLEAARVGEDPNMGAEALPFSYVWSGDHGVRWQVIVDGDDVYANPVACSGERVYSKVILAENATDDADALAAHLGVNGAGASGYELVKVDRINSQSLDAWAEENLASSDEASSESVEVASEPGDEGQMTSQSNAARAPTAEEGGSDER